MSAANASCTWSPSRSIGRRSGAARRAPAPRRSRSRARPRVAGSRRTARVLERDARVPASVIRSRSPFAERMLAVDVLQRDHARGLPTDRSGAKIADFGTSPESTARLISLGPSLMSCSSLTTTVWLVSRACVTKPMTRSALRRRRTPLSMMYREIDRGSTTRSRMPMSTTCASKISWSRSPTRS